VKADSRYATEPKAHIFWHEVLIGILGTSPQLQQQYVGGEKFLRSDSAAYTAVTRDLQARNDTSSPIVRKLADGGLAIDPTAGWSEYERLARSLTLRIIRDHPIAVAETVAIKAKVQLGFYHNPIRHSVPWVNLLIPLAIVAMAALICMTAGGFDVGRGTLGGLVGAVGVVLLFASVTPLIEPSPLSIGSLLCCLGVIAIGIPYALVLSLDLKRRHASS
jgi:hypothetical protein